MSRRQEALLHVVDVVLVSVDFDVVVDADFDVDVDFGVDVDSDVDVDVDLDVDLDALVLVGSDVDRCSVDHG